MATGMTKVEEAVDYSGRKVEKGDTVILMSDNSSAKVADLAKDGDQFFLRLRPLHQPYGRGVWLPSDHVVFQSPNRKNKNKGNNAVRPLEH